MSVGWSTEGAALGTKNFGFDFVTGFTGAAEGDWNNFVAFPPPWLKVSTYLQKKLILKRKSLLCQKWVDLGFVLMLIGQQVILSPCLLKNN